MGRKISPGRQWFESANRVRQRAVSKLAGTKRQFEAHIYGSNVVRAALNELFYGKCAYCEYSFGRSDVNVEHYRPKGRVLEDPKHPGYYWLAYSWSNLLPACTSCNQRRRELPLWPATTRGRAAGKADSFPLVDATQRAYSPNDRISREEPLLINPTMEEPARHLTFDPFGAPIHISDKGKASIAVYNLDTRPLNGLRKRVIIEMVRLLKMKEQAKRLPPLPEKTNLLTDIRAQIRDKTAPSAPYAAAARAVANNPVSFGL